MLLKIVYLKLIAAVFFSFSADSLHDREQEILNSPPPVPLATCELPQFTKATADSEPHTLRIVIVLGFEENDKLREEIMSRQEEIIHIINILLAGKKYDDLDSVTDTINLSEEIKAHVNIRLNGGKIKEIYFKEYILN